MNPARSFGPALYNMNFKSHWIYWAAPLSSALITAVAFRAIFYIGEPKESHTQLTTKEVDELPLRDVKSNHQSQITN